MTMGVVNTFRNLSGNKSDSQSVLLYKYNTPAFMNGILVSCLETSIWICKKTITKHVPIVPFVKTATAHITGNVSLKIVLFKKAIRV